ncbi:VUT family protein [Martelella endophytica]|uniref:Probable queuosine precursor transporter n=1 Tax=Martelella endophytica TaxID=1486262 RepID=A0A0D5LU39_MAREN|nr:VUT family protein [Martelella endophytica]AJY47485.1 membrane protein [Martelella endophytica]
MRQTQSVIIYSLLMAGVVLASNILVQYPVQGTVYGISLADLLTWGAFTYPFAFLVNDLTNRQFGPSAARKVVFAGFVVGVAFSFYASVPRIAIASGTAFLIGQLLDVTLFNRLRRQTWWKAPLIGSLFGSTIDTVLFFSISFAAVFAFIGPNDEFALGFAPLFGVFPIDIPRWISWALGDLSVKLLFSLIMLLPYGALMTRLKPMRAVEA